jgi:hypothetical protein
MVAHHEFASGAARTGTAATSVIGFSYDCLEPQQQCNREFTGERGCNLIPF